jgi:DNA invertase Pin-like site-specific DNA recombinase
MKFVGYVRSARPNPASLAAQTLQIRASCPETETVSIIADDGVSGNTLPETRSGWSSLRAAIEDEQDEIVLLVAGFERISRDYIDLFTELEWLHDRGVVVRLASPKFSEDGHEDHDQG